MCMRLMVSFLCRCRYVCCLWYLTQQVSQVWRVYARVVTWCCVSIHSPEDARSSVRTQWERQRQRTFTFTWQQLYKHACMKDVHGEGSACCILLRVSHGGKEDKKESMGFPCEDWDWQETGNRFFTVLLSVVCHYSNKRVDLISWGTVNKMFVRSSLPMIWVYVLFVCLLYVKTCICISIFPLSL